MREFGVDELDRPAQSPDLNTFHLSSYASQGRWAITFGNMVYFWRDEKSVAIALK